MMPLAAAASMMRIISVRKSAKVLNSPVLGTPSFLRRRCLSLNGIGAAARIYRSSGQLPTYDAWTFGIAEWSCESWLGSNNRASCSEKKSGVVFSYSTGSFASGRIVTGHDVTTYEPGPISSFESSLPREAARCGAMTLGIVSSIFYTHL